MTEWEPMRALLIAYPAETAQFEQASDTFVGIARYASEHGEVWVLVDGSQAETIFKQKLAQGGVAADKIGTVIKFSRAPFDTHWLIDYGPLPLVDMTRDSYAFADFRYYHERTQDDAIPTLLGRQVTAFGERFPVTTYRLPLTLEGGTFQATSDGVCITSSRELYNMSCLAGSCRESILGLTLAELQAHSYAREMEGVLAAYVGCKDLIVTHSISDDGTGHIDMYLKVLDDALLLLGEYRPPFGNDYQRENAALMNDNAAFLEAYVKPGGGRFQVLRLPMPGHRMVSDFFGSYEVPFTYLNSTFFNGLNLWPAYTFGEWSASRAEAQAIWEEALPDMEHQWIDAEELSYQSGAIHCVTRTIPLKKAIPWVLDGDCQGGTCGGSEGGYAGSCELSGQTDLCWGPAWLCACNDCRTCPGSVPESPCGAIGWRGCCDAGDVLFCESSELRRLPCAGTGCGWDGEASYYSCGLEGADPSGQVSASCVCAPSCGDRGCGDDGCAGTCGTCSAGEQCVAGTCRSDCATCQPGEMGCHEAVSWRCVEGAPGCPSIAQVDCAASGLTCLAGDCVSSGGPEPALAEATTDKPRRCHWAASAMTWRTTQGVISRIKPVCSANGMNCIGGIMLLSGCRQRISASAAVIWCCARFSLGW